MSLKLMMHYESDSKLLFLRLVFTFENYIHFPSLFIRTWYHWTKLFLFTVNNKHLYTCMASLFQLRRKEFTVVFYVGF